MDDERRGFLFGAAGVAGPDGDLDDDDFEPGGGDRLGRRLEVGRRLVAMIERDDPPEVWATARRLLDLGLDRREVLGQVRMVVREHVLDLPHRVDRAGMVAALGALPVPSAAELTEVYVAEAAARPGGLTEDVEAAVRARFGLGPVADRRRDPFEWRFDVVADLPMSEDSPLEWLSGNRIVNVASVTEGIVLTHRLTEAEREACVLPAAVDLAGFRRRSPLRLAGGQAVERVGSGGRHGFVDWEGPAGWLDGFKPGDLLVVGVAADGVVSVERADAEPAVDRALVARLRAVYDEEVDEPWVPVSVEELIIGLLVGDRDTFARPQPPLTALIDAAGLERRGAVVAHDDSVWREADSFGRQRRWELRLGEQRAFLAGRVFDSIYGEAHYRNDTGPQGEDAARLALADHELGASALDEAVPVDDALPDDVAAARKWADDLLASARTDRERAVARWLAALVAERGGDPLAAGAHLDLALDADAFFGPAVDRAGWYASDRGDAALAVRLWRRLEQPSRDELDEVELAARVSARTPGRNEPCWCGSGRKYKTCHLPEPAAIPLPDRVGWLCRKAVSYVERRGGEALDDTREAVYARAADPDDVDRVGDALDDPIVFDAVLTEGGWFREFLRERGPLLPDDEALLGATWLAVARTVYEVESVRPGAGMTVRDLRSAESIEVRERTFSRTVQPGQRFCGRAVPDGETHQFIGAIFPVRVGEEAALLDLCDEGDPFELCRWVGALYRPPVITNREGEPLVESRCVLQIPDPDVLAEMLDVRYEAQDGQPGTWAEMHELAPGERILRATLTLDPAAGRLTVETNSDDRMDRVLASLEGAGWDLDIIEESTRPLDPGSWAGTPPGPSDPGAAAESGVRLDAATMARLQDDMARRWLDESVPALGGVTPRAAAADPTRRDALVRLIDSFSEPDPDSGFFSFRPARLRELLDLPAVLRAEEGEAE